MTEIPTDTDVAGLLASWLPRQRWFSAGPGGVTLTSAGQLRPAVGEPGTPGGVQVVVHFVTAQPTGGVPAPPATYQVPLTYRAAEDPALSAALLGKVTDPAGAQADLWIYDAPHDPVFVAAWLRLIAEGGEAMSEPGAPRGRIRGVRRVGQAVPRFRSSKVLSGEQSNTSIIIGDPAGPDAIMVKLFRVLQAGRNPDVVVPGALGAAGCDRVPRLVGWVEGEWMQPSGGPAWGHLSAAAEFIGGSTDGWRIATGAVHAGTSFATAAAALGAATAEVHAALARALPTRPTTPLALNALADHLSERLEWAVGAAPALADQRPAAEAVIASVREVTDAPDRQLIHGDLHLGQALLSDARGWVILDFEGEPLRPLSERGAPDLALRDVAGMLRSFDYAARHSVLGLPDDDERSLTAAAWASECREAFLTGYAREALRDPRADHELLRALELDKALYETVYETRHRPGWVEVPLRAVGRLLGAPAPAPRMHGV